MNVIKQIRDKNAQRGDLILKAFGQNEPTGYFDKLDNMSKSESVQIIEKALNDDMVDDKTIDRLIKAKYIRRIGSPGSYRYEYSEVHTAGRKTKNGGNATGNECWKMTKKEYKDSGNEQSEAYHRNGIVNALREGKPVPQEVLNDYPDLKGIKKEGGEKKDETKESDNNAPKGFKSPKYWSQLPSADEIKINVGSIVKPKYVKAKIWQHHNDYVVLGYGDGKTRRVDNNSLSSIYIK